MRFGALLFDLDGTLVDSHHEICLALERALIEAEFRLHFDDVRKLVDGSPLEVIWEKLHPASKLAASRASEEGTPRVARAQNRELEHELGFAPFAQSYRRHYMQDLGHASALFPGVMEALDQLRAQHASAGFSVVSNKSASSVEPLLVRFGIQRYFDLALGCGGTPVPPKPHPDLLLEAASRLGARPDSCVMIGDTALDVEAGKRAGMRTIAITHGMASRAELLHAEADHLLDSFGELAALLSN